MKGLILCIVLSFLLVGCGQNRPVAKQPETPEQEQTTAEIKAEEEEVDEALEDILNQLDELDQILDGNREE